MNPTQKQAEAQKLMASTKQVVDNIVINFSHKRERALLADSAGKTEASGATIYPDVEKEL